MTNLKTIRLSFLTVLVLLSLTTAGKDDFSLLEQQQISIETPGLFKRSNAFTVNFGSIRDGEYSFPLPVGKSKLQRDNSVEINTVKGDAVKAMFAGTVRLSRNSQSYGNVIVVRHDNGLETVYARNAQNLVKVGDRVKAGQTIAIVGGEGTHTYCQFFIMVNGCRINPEMIFNLSSHRLHRQTLLCKKQGFNVNLTVVEPSASSQSGRERANVATFDSNGRLVLNLAAFKKSQWSYPLPDAKVISPFGRRGGRTHSGVDIKTKPNDNILAAFDGVVTFSQRYAAYGNYIKIKHDNGIETAYSHNSKNLVREGDRVKAGQVIGLTGQTGRATTAHLHFECRINGQVFDPSYVFDHQSHTLQQHQLTFSKRGGSISIKADKSGKAKKR